VHDGRMEEAGAWAAVVAALRKGWAYMRGLFSAPRRLDKLEVLLPLHVLRDAVAPLGDQNHHARLSAIREMNRLARTSPTDFHVSVMQHFEAFLTHPPVYGQRHPKKGQVDPHSVDTRAVMTAIAFRTEAQMSAEREEGYTFHLSLNSPFSYCDGAFCFDGECLVGPAPKAEASPADTPCLCHL